MNRVSGSKGLEAVVQDLEVVVPNASMSLCVVCSLWFRVWAGNGGGDRVLGLESGWVVGDLAGLVVSSGEVVGGREAVRIMEARHLVARRGGGGGAHLLNHPPANQPPLKAVKGRESGGSGS